MNVRDVAAYILSKTQPLPAMKLQKLVYYCQAWSLVWDDRPMFPERIEAWANGPVCTSLYSAHHRQYEVHLEDMQKAGGRPDRLDEAAKETVDSVVEFYGKQSSQWLSDLTHREDPWVIARGDTPAGESSNAVISHASMADYYSSLA